jgi:hypothetical protein
MRIVATLLIRRALAALLAVALVFAPPVAFASQDFQLASTGALVETGHDHPSDGAARDLHKHSHSHDRSAPDHSHESGTAAATYQQISPVLNGGWGVGTEDLVPGRTNRPPQRPPRLIARL